jgi:hypothetical protein
MYEHNGSIKGIQTNFSLIIFISTTATTLICFSNMIPTANQQTTPPVPAPKSSDELRFWISLDGLFDAFRLPFLLFVTTINTVLILNILYCLFLSIGITLKTLAHSLAATENIFGWAMLIYCILVFGFLLVVGDGTVEAGDAGEAELGIILESICIPPYHRGEYVYSYSKMGDGKRSRKRRLSKARK